MDAPRRPSPGSPTSLKEANQARLLDALRGAGTMTQAELARFTGLAPSTISNIVRELTASGLLEVSPTVSRGRTAQAVRLSRAAGRPLDGLGLGRAAVVGVGMGLPAPIDVRTGQVGAPSQLPGRVGVDALACLLTMAVVFGTAPVVDGVPQLGGAGLGLAYGLYALLAVFFVVKFIRETKGKELEEMV